MGTLGTVEGTTRRSTTYKITEKWNNHMKKERTGILAREQEIGICIFFQMNKMRETSNFQEF